MTFKHYSNLMGKSDAFLSEYCYYNGIKDKTPREVYDMVQERIKHEAEVVQKMQELNYKLSKHGEKASFGKFLVSKGLFKHDIQLHQTINASFMVERGHLMKRTQIKRMEIILGYFEEYSSKK